jgi:LysM repeat protein
MAERVYVVKSGDSLGKIAKEVYGDAGRWKEIYEANKDTIKNPDVIHPGQELHIPEAATAAAEVKGAQVSKASGSIKAAAGEEEPEKGMKRHGGPQEE